MAVEKITNMHAGINLMDDPVQLSPGQTQECLGFDLTIGGRLQTSKGDGDHDLTGKVPNRSDFQWLQILVMQGNEYVLATTPAGLYVNGALVDTLVTGRFKAITINDQIYITNGIVSRRYDGTTSYRWGIAGPSSIPAITIGDNIVKDIDTFESVTDWIAHASSCVCSLENSIKKEGSHSLKYVIGGTGTYDIKQTIFNGVGTDDATIFGVPTSTAIFELSIDAVDTSIIAVVLSAAGTGYSVNDILTVAGGAGGKVTVTSIGVAGAVSTVALTTPGTGYTTASAVATSYGGAGTGCKVDTTALAGNDTFKWRKGTGAWTTGVAIDGTPQTIAELTVTFGNLTGHALGDEWIVITESTPSTTGAVSASSYRTVSLDLTKLSDGSASSDINLIQFWFYIVGLVNLKYLRISFDLVGNGFTTDYYACDLPFSGADQGQYVPGMGSLTPVVNTTGTTPPGISTVPPLGVGKTFNYQATPQPSFLDFFSFLQPQPASINYVNTTPTMNFKESSWNRFSISKNYFLRVGNGNYDWSDVKAVKIEAATTGGEVTIYFDGLKLAGGSDLFGDYYFTQGWGRGDTAGTVRHYSCPAKDSTGQLVTQGPFHIECQPVEYGTRTISADPQVNRTVLYILGGNLPDWWVYGIVDDNLTTSGSFHFGEDDCVQKMVSIYNDPAPTGTDLVYQKGRVYMIDGSSMVGFSEISTQGDFMPEAWPLGNREIIGFQGGHLLNIRAFNNNLVVRGDRGEWQCGMQDPTDITTFFVIPVSDKPMLGQDSLIEMSDAHIYPTPNGFVLSGGGVNKIILPNVAPMVTTSGMSAAKAVVSGLYGYLNFIDPILGWVTAKFDFLTGSPRVSLLNKAEYACLAIDFQGSKVYGIREGQVVLLETDYDNQDRDMALAVISGGITPGGDMEWDSMTFTANTNNRWLMVRAIVDGTEVDHMPFQCNGQEEVRFDFGPVTGRVFQFKIDGEYQSNMAVYFPIRVRYYGSV